MAQKPDRDGESEHDGILRQLKDRYRYATEQWREIREAGREDLKYLTGDPWTAEDRELRKGRPMIAADQLTQYTNQLINGVRTNPLAIKVSPRGAGATNKTAELRANKIREIEYRSNAELVYITMFGNTVQRGYGFMAVRRKWASERADLSAFNQELWLEAIVNPDLVTPDPDTLMPDGSDMRFCFEGEWMDADSFKAQYPKAEIRDFDAECVNAAPDWFRDGGRKVLVCNYWVVKESPRTLLLLKPPPPDLASLPPGRPVLQKQPIAVFEDELGDVKPSDEEILDRREVTTKEVCVYKTNGVEILSTDPWPGKYIPIIACFGKVEYVDSGSGAKKVLMSLIRLARDLQKGYDYTASTGYEAVGMAIKTALMGWEGQADQKVQELIAKALHQPVAFIGFKTMDPATGQPFPSLPMRPPNQMAELISGIEILKESTRRDIQAAIGSNPLPTQAQRRNEKSGVALQRISEQEEQGSYHFKDHYKDSIRHGGVIIDDLLDKTYDAQRETAVRKVDGTQESIRINDPQSPYENSDEYARFDVGDHDLIITTGTNFNSEREQASDFADTLIGAKEVLAIVGPEKAAKLLGMAIRLKNVGHMGDQIADLVSPPEAEDGAEASPDALKSQLAEMSAKGQQAMQALQQAQMELKTDAAKQQAAIQQTQINARKDVAIQKMRDATSIAVAIINARAKGVLSDNEGEMEAAALAAEQAHQAEQQRFDRAHELGMAAQAHDRATELNAQQHAQGLEAGDVAHQQGLEAQEQAAALQPPAEGA